MRDKYLNILNNIHTRNTCITTSIATVILIKCTTLKSRKFKGSARPRNIDIMWSRTRCLRVCLLSDSQQGHEGTTSNPSPEGVSTVSQAVEG